MKSKELCEKCEHYKYSNNPRIKPTEEKICWKEEKVEGWVCKEFLDLYAKENMKEKPPTIQERYDKITNKDRKCIHLQTTGCVQTGKDCNLNDCPLIKDGK